MRTHKLKLLPVFCDAVFSREKTFEIRENDRGYQKGDRIVFVPHDGSKHTIEGCKYIITYVLSGWGLKNGYVALGLEEERT